MMEKWDILNSQGQPTGKTVTRGHVTLRPGEYHLVVHIWVIDRSGKLLIQRRSDRKKLMPGEWAATGGAAMAGEDSFTAARRELLEELGIDSDRDTLKQIARLKRKNSFVDLWLLRRDVALTQLRLQKSEVATAKWVTQDELKKMVESGNFHNYGPDYFKTVFSACKKLEEEEMKL